jgi:UDP-glucose 4-epimerase
MRILVTGGAGYVGSFAVRALVAAGHEILVVDDLRQGHAAAIPGVPLIEGDFGDRAKMTQWLGDHAAEAVMHFAGSTSVAESVRDPGLHYRNNTSGTIALLEAMHDVGVRKLVFSSTAAVYGESSESPLSEDAPYAPTCAYGRSKLAIEWALADFGTAHGFSSCALRYFNAAGASEDGAFGEDHEPETHLIPIVFAALSGKRPHVELYGDDYDTPDGTCLRDYVHVEDLAAAHVLAIESCDAPGHRAFNVGSGTGSSVREVIDRVAEISRRPVPTRLAARRPGDPATLVASADRLRGELGWVPKRDLDAIIASAWRWHERHPDGYAG